MDKRESLKKTKPRSEMSIIWSVPDQSSEKKKSFTVYSKPCLGLIIEEDNPVITLDW